MSVTYTPDGRAVWPFPSVNGQQTTQSLALKSNKELHRPERINLNNIEDALL